MIDYFKGYERICMRKLSAQKHFIENHGSDYTLYNKILGFQRAMLDLIFPIFQKAYMGGDYGKLNPIQQAEQCILILCDHNIDYLGQSMDSLENYQYEVCESTMRPVFESIPKMFYILHRPQDTVPIFIKEQYSHWLDDKKIEYHNASKKISTKEALIQMFIKENSQPLSGFEDSTIENLMNERDKFTNAWFRKQIYTDKTLKLLDKQYGLLSASVHASFLRPHTYRGYFDKEDAKIYLKKLIDLAVYNLYILFNTFPEILTEIDEIDNVRKFMFNIQQSGKYQMADTFLYSTNPEYQEKLFFKMHKR